MIRGGYAKGILVLGWLMYRFDEGSVLMEGWCW